MTESLFLDGLIGVLMRKLFYFGLLLSILMICFSSGAWSQKITQTEKFKPVSAYPTIGGLKDSSEVSVDAAVKAIRMPLVIKDSAGNTYPIVAYQFVYERELMIEDPETGNVKSNPSIVGRQFYESPLPKIWIDNIGEQLKPGEALYFFDVLVKDAKDRNFYAKPLKIFVH